MNQCPNATHARVELTLDMIKNRMKILLLSVRLYYVYEITRIVRKEVYRNIGITMLCVLLMVIPMLASLQMGFWVALCVAMTTVDVAGTMYFAGNYNFFLFNFSTLSCI